MATTITDFLTSLGIRLGYKTLSTTSTPTTTQVYQALYEACDWLSVLCAQLESEIGRKLASISLADGTASYSDIVNDVIAVAERGWLLKSTERVELKLATEFDSIDYNPAAAAEVEPEYYYLDGNGNLTFLQTPDASYTAKIPYWYHQTKIAATSYTITGATKANPCVLTVTSHGFNTGDRTYVESVGGMTELNKIWFTVTNVSANSVSLNGINSSSYTTYTSGGTASTAVPFNGVFDHVITEAVSIGFQNIDEYNQDFESSWLNFLMSEARKIIFMRKNPGSKILR